MTAEWKLRGKQQKYILRKLAERVGVPREVLYRQKQGFSLPLVHWMRNELQDMLMILLEPRTLERGYFVADGVRKLMDDHLHRGRTMTGRLWRLLMFELWHRNFLEKFVRPAGLFSLPVVADSRRQVPSSGSSAGFCPGGRMTGWQPADAASAHFRVSAYSTHPPVSHDQHLRDGRVRAAVCRPRDRICNRERFQASSRLHSTGWPLRRRLGPVPEFRLGGSLFGWRRCVLGCAWRSHLRRNRIQIAHAFDFYTNLTLIPAARLARVPVVIGSHRQLGDLLTPAQFRVQASGISLV